MQCIRAVRPQNEGVGNICGSRRAGDPHPIALSVFQPSRYVLERRGNIGNDVLGSNESQVNPGQHRDEPRRPGPATQQQAARFGDRQDRTREPHSDLARLRAHLGKLDEIETPSREMVAQPDLFGELEGSEENSAAILLAGGPRQEVRYITYTGHDMSLPSGCLENGGKLFDERWLGGRHTV